MTDALTRLERETATVRALLGDAVRRLAADRDDIGTSLRDAIGEIDSLAAGIDGAEGWPAGCDETLDGLLRSAYTMADERQIHAAFLAEAGAAAPRQGVGAARRLSCEGDEPIAAVA